MTYAPAALYAATLATSIVIGYRQKRRRTNTQAAQQ